MRQTKMRTLQLFSIVREQLKIFVSFANSASEIEKKKNLVGDFLSRVSRIQFFNTRKKVRSYNT